MKPTPTDETDAEIGLVVARLAERERIEQRNIERLYTQEEADKLQIAAWFAGWMSRDIAEYEIQQQRLKQEGLVS